jgi:hypothetical protein
MIFLVGLSVTLMIVSCVRTAPYTYRGNRFMGGNTSPPIAQTLIREGDFAINLAETLKIGQAKSEAEAENMLASVGIAPKNGWIADYPVTPDVIGELQNAIGTAVDSGKLAMKKDEAMKTLQELTAQQGLPVRADTESQYPGAEPPRSSEPRYSEPEVIDNYYYDQGPPIVSYHPPPWDYYYLYSWVPFPFWCSGFWFPGFFVLHDFHKIIIVNGKVVIISNHMIDPKTGRVVPVDPGTRGPKQLPHTIADASHTRGYASPEARRGAASIFVRSSGMTSARSSVSFSGRSSRRGSQGGDFGSRGSLGRHGVGHR